MLEPNERTELEEERTGDTLISSRKKELHKAFFLIIILLYGFVLCGLADGLKISRGQQLPTLDLVFLNNLESVENVQMILSVSWDAPPEGQTEIIRPLIVLNGTDTLQESANSGRPVTIDREISLALIVPKDCTPIAHTGEIRYQSLSGNPEIRSGYPITVAIPVSDSFWENWHLTKTYILVIILVLTLLYIGAAIANPRPYGKILFTAPQRGRHGHQRVVRLRMPRIGWLIPTRRSRVSLRRVFRQAGVSVPFLIDAELIFLQRTSPPYLHIKGLRGGKIKRTMSNNRNDRLPSPDQGRDIRSSDKMKDLHVYRYWYRDKNTEFRFEDRK